tara:strand:+ start:298 stop:531 length:234 start_codon:yes stop_codon:yes gene_type:complete
MNNRELDLYSNELSGGKSVFQDEINLTDGKSNETISENDKKTLRLYKKRIIEQRNEIKSLNKQIKSLQKEIKIAKNK